MPHLILYFILQHLFLLMFLLIFKVQNNIYLQEKKSSKLIIILKLTSDPNTVLNPDPSKECALKLSSDNFNFTEQ